MAWPDGDVFPSGWTSSGTGWTVDAVTYLSAGSSLKASASSFDSATLTSPMLDIPADAPASFSVRFTGSTSSNFSVAYTPEGGSPTGLLAPTVIADGAWREHTVTVPAGRGQLGFRVMGMSGTAVNAWIDDVVLPGAGAADIIFLAWQLVVLPPRAVVSWPVRVGDSVAAAWPLEVLPPRAVVAWPLSVGAAPAVVAAAAWPVRVGALSSAAVPWSVGVLDDAVVGGLDGAAGWAAAPGGKWQVRVLLDGVDVSARIAGPVTVRMAADSASVADFVFSPVSPMQPLGLIGRPVQIDFSESGGANVQRLFTGVVETPAVDVVTGLVTCDCHDQAQEVWSNTPRETIDAMVGGRWHPALGEVADNLDYLRARLESVGASWALDSYQQPRILPWRDQSRPYSVQQADVIDGNVALTLPSRSDLRSRIACRLQYRYTRLRWRGALAQYSQPLGFFVRPDLDKGIVGKQWLSRAEVLSALEGVQSWELVGAVNIEAPRPQAISPPGAVGGLGGIYMITAQSARELALGFRASYRARWEQSVTEDWTVSVVWPAIEAQLGQPVSEEIGATLEAVFDSPAWIMDPTVSPVTDTIYLGDLIQPWQPAGADFAARDEVLRTLLDRAWVRLWASSRSGRAQFDVPCRPDVWLDAWIDLQAAHITTAGKVIEVVHTLDPIEGSAVSSITLAVGMPGAAAVSHPMWTLPAAPADPYIPPPEAYSFECGTFVGGEPDSPEFEEATMIGFATNIEDASLTDIERDALNWYPHQFNIREPDIAAEDRDPLELEIVTEIAVSVPTDTLEIV